MGVEVEVGTGKSWLRDSEENVYKDAMDQVF